MLSEKEAERYARQLVYAKIGKKGQEKLRKSRIGILGLGALGSTAANYLARAGANLKLIDRDYVELNNLQRQLLFDEEDAAEKRPKAVAAKEKLGKINSDIKIKASIEDFNPRTAEELLRDCDFVIDGTDNMETRFLLNEVCVKNGIAWAYGGAIESYGMTFTIIPKSACFACIFPKIPKPGSLETCESVGVLGFVAGIIGSIEAGEAVKYICGFGKPNTKLISVNLLDLSFRKIEVEKRKKCRVCAEHNYELLKGKRKGTFITSICGRNAVQVVPPKTELDLKKFAKRLSAIPECSVERASEIVLHFKYGKYLISVFRTGRAIIKNCKDEGEAKSILSKFLGL